jgi:hypothetical protein
MVYWEAIDMLRRIILISVVPLLGTTTLLRATIGEGISFLFLLIYCGLMPYNTPSTNKLSIIACVVIFLTFSGSRVIETGVSNGIDDLLFGCILLVINLFILCVSLFAAYIQEKQYRDKIRARKDKNVKLIEWACGFSKVKFDTTLETIKKTVIPQTHAAFIYYGSLVEIKQILRSGIELKAPPPPSSSSSSNIPSFEFHENIKNTNDNDSCFDGILFTKHHPFLLSNSEIELFKCREAFVVCSLPKNLMTKISKKTNIELQSFHQNEVEESELVHDMNDNNVEEDIWVLKRSVLESLRSFNYESIVDPEPWLEGKLLLPPQCIKRAYQIVNVRSSFINACQHPLKQISDSNNNGNHNSSESLNSNNNNNNNAILMGRTSSAMSEVSDDLSFYLNAMDNFRDYCKENNLVPLYHYTMPAIAPLIQDGGFRMSTQGQGDGGVYFSTQGPATYGIGTEEYEENLIIDCFGKERLEEYKGKHKLDVCFVYGADPSIIEQAPGGRDNAVVIPKIYFEDLSLPHIDGNYFLRPDRILGSFLFDPTVQPSGYDVCLDRLKIEEELDLDVQSSIIHRHTSEHHSMSSPSSSSSTSTLPIIQIEDFVKENDELSPMFNIFL